MNKLERSDTQERQSLVDLDLASAASGDVHTLTNLEKDMAKIVPDMFSRFSPGKLETFSHIVNRLITVDPATVNAHLVNSLIKKCFQFTEKYQKEKGISALHVRLTAYKISVLNHLITQTQDALLADVNLGVPVAVLKEKLHLFAIERELTKWKFTKLAIQAGSSPKAIAAVIADKSDPLGEVRSRVKMELCFHMPIVNKFIKKLYFHGVIYSKDLEIQRSMLQTPELLNLHLKNVCISIDNTGLKKKLMEAGLIDRLKQAGVSADIQKELLRNPGTRDGFRSWFIDTFFHLPPSTEEYMSYYIRIAKLHSDLTLVLNADAKSAQT